MAVGVTLLLVALISACAPAAAPTPPTAPTPKAAAAVPTPSPATPKPAPPTPTATPSPAKVRLASISTITDAGIYIATEKGYFKQEAIDVEAITVKTSADAVPLLARGDIDVAGGSSAATLFNAIARAIDMKKVADKGSFLQGFGGFGGYVVRKDLVGQIKTPADMKGKKIGAQCRLCNMDQLLSVLLKRGGLTFKDVELVDLGQPDQLVALTSKSIDMAYLIEPYITMAGDQGLGVLLIASGDIIPGQQATVLIFSPTFAANVDAARRFIVAYLKGVRDYNDAFRKNKG
ncbi:MAG: ABC transporter substrate-binding protein, partial [Dehalococcoidia bacterium]|nr:ABC transporter substrate-binding protein [Dehalococcoidia bacterium]